MRASYVHRLQVELNPTYYLVQLLYEYSRYYNRQLYKSEEGLQLPTQSCAVLKNFLQRLSLIIGVTAGTLLEQGAKKSGMKKKILAKIEHVSTSKDSAINVSQLKLRSTKTEP